MIKKVRNEFILTAMLAMTFCVVLLIGSINIINYRQVDMKLTTILEEMCSEDQNRQEDIEVNRKQIEVNEPLENAEKKDKRNKLHATERLYQSRYFTIRIPVEGEQDVITTNDSITSEETRELADQILTAYQKNRNLQDYKYQVYQTDMGTTIHILDCSTENNAIRSLLWTSILIGLFSLVVIFIFIYYMSGKAVKPLLDSMEKQKQFITDASHELKTPVSVISTNMEILKMDIGVNEWIDSTQRQVVKLRKLIAHLISLSRMEESVNEVERLSFSLSDAVLDCVEVYETMAEAEGKKLTAEVTEGIQIFAEEKSIREMLTVLLENAVKYSSDGSLIEITLRKEGKKIIFTTENDWAHDVETADLPKLFERFYRGDKSRNRDQKNSGYGLGLSIARTAAERNRGTIRVEETQEGRILFKVFLKYT